MSDRIRRLLSLLSDAPPKPMSRREFLQRVGGAAALAAVPGKVAPPKAAPRRATPLDSKLHGGFDLPANWRLTYSRGDYGAERQSDPGGLAEEWGVRWEAGPETDYADTYASFLPDGGEYRVRSSAVDTLPGLFERTGLDDLDALQKIAEQAAKALPETTHKNVTYYFNHLTGQWHPYVRKYVPESSHKWQDAWWSADGEVPASAMIDDEEKYASRWLPENRPDLAYHAAPWRRPGHYDQVPTVGRSDIGDGYNALRSATNDAHHARFLLKMRNDLAAHRENMQGDSRYRRDFLRVLDEKGLAPGGRPDPQPVMGLDDDPLRRGSGVIPEAWNQRVRQIPFKKPGRGAIYAPAIGAALLAPQEEKK